MPYGSTKEVPDYVPADKRKQWMEVFNSAYAKAKKDGKSDKAAEASAFKQANAVAGPKSQSRMAGGQGRLITAIAAAGASKAPEWIECIPAGEFTGRDGRGPYTLEDPKGVIEATLAQDMAGEIVVDYDHASDFAAPEGRPSPAAGWMRKFKVVNGAIWAKVEWTGEGAKHVSAKHWKYFSPVFEHEKDGTVTRLLRGALTNNPNLELQAVAAARKSRMAGNADVDLGKVEDALKKAFPSFGRDQIVQLIEYACELEEHADYPEGAEGEQMTKSPYDKDYTFEEEDSMKPERDNDEMDKECARNLRGDGKDPSPEEMSAMRRALDARHVKSEEAWKKDEAAKKAAAAEAAAATKAAEDDEDGDEDANAKKKDDDEDENSTHTQPSQEPFTRAAKNSRATRADKQVMSLTTKLNNLERERAVEKATAAVDEAIKARKLTPAQRAWGIDYASRDPRGFATFASNQPTLLSPTDPVRTNLQAGSAPGGTMAEVCANLGIDPDKAAAHFEATKNRPGSGAALIARHSA